MFDPKCIFCKIIQKEINSKTIKENEHAIVIQDLYPKAPIHYLILPKKHIININDFSDQDAQFYAPAMLQIARDVAKEIQKAKQLTEPLAFNIVVNNGAAAGQSVFHSHWHLISGKGLCLDGQTL